MDTTLTDTPRLFPLQEARLRLGGISHEGIYKLFRSGQLNRTKVGRRTMVSSAEIARFIDENTEGP